MAETRGWGIVDRNLHMMITNGILVDTTAQKLYHTAIETRDSMDENTTEPRRMTGAAHKSESDRRFDHCPRNENVILGSQSPDCVHHWPQNHSYQNLNLQLYLPRGT